MKRLIMAAVMACALAACGGEGEEDTGESAAPPVGVSAGGEQAAGQQAAGQQAGATPAAPASGAPAPSLAERMANRTGELVSPEHPQMVLLYYSVAGINPPIESWVENDRRVRSADALDKDARRAEVSAELAAIQQSVASVGKIRMTLDAQLSDYDTNFGEFTVRALAPSSSRAFRQFDRTVELRFRNGQYAQIWRVPAEEARAIVDRAGAGRYVTIDALLQIVDVQPGANGGTIMADVLEYEMRSRNGGQLVGRVKVGG